jgi:hypothetical protein
VKKNEMLAVIALCAVCGAGVFAQRGEAVRVGSFSQEYVLKYFIKARVIDNKIYGVDML